MLVCFKLLTSTCQMMCWETAAQRKAAICSHLLTLTQCVMYSIQLSLCITGKKKTWTNRLGTEAENQTEDAVGIVHCPADLH